MNKKSIHPIDKADGYGVYYGYEKREPSWEPIVVFIAFLSLITMGAIYSIVSLLMVIGLV